MAVGAFLFFVAWAAYGQGLRVSDQPSFIYQAGKDNRAIAFSPDSKFLAVGGGSMFDRRTITVFEMPGGRRILELLGHNNQINGLAFTPDGTRLISGSNDRSIRIWEIPTGRQVGQIQDMQEIRGVACAAGGTLIAAGGSQCCVTVWDLATSAGKGQLQRHAKAILAVAASADGRLIASGSHDETVMVWDLQQNAMVRALQGNGSEITSVAFSPDGSRLAAGTEEEAVMQWTLPDFAGPTAMMGHSNDVLSVAYSPDGRYLASGSRDRDVIVWDAQTGQLIHRRLIGQDPYCLAFSPDGHFLAVGTTDKGVFIFELDGAGGPPPGIVVAQKPTGPDIRLLTPGAPQMNTSGPKIMVTGLVSDPEGITRVSVNGLDARLADPTPEEIEKFGREHKIYRFIGEALLVVGENRIQIMAMDAKGNVAEKMIVVNRMVGTVDADGTQRVTTTSTMTQTETAGAGKRFKIAVLDLNAQGVSPVTAQVLSESLRTELYNSGRFRVMNREDVDKVLKEKEFERTVTTDSNAKIAEMGTALGVDKMVTGSIGKLGTTYSVTLRVVDVVSHENERIATERHRGTEDDLFLTVEMVAKKLVAGY